jgi:hypothetical protein
LGIFQSSSWHLQNSIGLAFLAKQNIFLNSKTPQRRVIEKLLKLSGETRSDIMPKQLFNFWINFNKL